MNHDFKAGDLAIVIGALNVPENLGKCVELVRFVRAGEMAIDGPTIEDLWVIHGDGVGYFRGDDKIIGNIGLSISSHLMPLKGDFEPVKEKQEAHHA